MHGLGAGASTETARPQGWNRALDSERFEQPELPARIVRAAEVISA
jgi:hypothetical protein